MNITEILDELAIPYVAGGSHRHVSTGWAGVNCQRCSPHSGKFKLGINLTSWGCSCWTCGRLNLAEELSSLSGKPITYIRSLLGKRSPSVFTKTIPKGNLELPSGICNIMHIHRNYLQDRGFDPDELVRLWGVQGIGLHPKLSWRIFIPIYHQDRMVSWTSRATSDQAYLRYVTATPEQSEISPKQVLFGLDYVREVALVCEGPFDVFRIGPGAVATLGVDVSPSQIKQLSKIPVRVICFDSEFQAQRRATQLCNLLSPLPGRTVRVELSSKDPGSAAPEEVRQLRREFFHES